MLNIYCLTQNTLILLNIRLKHIEHIFSNNSHISVGSNVWETIFCLKESFDLLYVAYYAFFFYICNTVSFSTTSIVNSQYTLKKKI